MSVETTHDFYRSYSSTEFEALPDDGSRYELIGGRLVMTAPAGDDHGTIADAIYRCLVLFDPEMRLGKVWVTTGVRLDDENTLEPDLTFVMAGRVPARRKEVIEVIPDLVVEVWSPSQLARSGPDKALLEKIVKYQAAGVRIIWSINPAARTVEVYHAAEPGPVATLKVEDSLDGEDVIPGFRLAVKLLFE